MGAYNVVNRAAMVTGQPEDISIPLANFDAIAAVLNGGLDNSNINAAAAILASKFSGYPASGAQVLKGDGTWGSVTQAMTAAGNKITTSAMSGGPPGGPTDGDIWVATGIGPDSVRWIFQYDAAEATYKWKYLGGPAQYSGTSATAIPGTSVWTVLASLAVSRAGLYKFEGSIQGINNAGGTATDYMGAGVNGALVQQVGRLVITVPSGDFSMSGFTDVTVAVAGQNINLMGWSNLAPNTLVEWLQVTPVKVI